MFQQVILALFVALLGYLYKALRPPPPKKCGSPGGPPVTSPRIRLTDGRHLAYREFGVSKEEAKYKIIFLHGLNCCKDQTLPVSQELVEELKLYFVAFDRAGYGESDPHPRRSVESEAYDIQELADSLKLGSKFYVMGISMGGYSAWSCIRYIPERLAGVSLVVPFIHYWWPRFPSEISKEAWRKLIVPGRWTWRVAHYTPWLVYWFMTQEWFPALRFLPTNNSCLPREVLEILEKQVNLRLENIHPQGAYESVHRDLIVSCGNWGFSPLDLKNPFPENEGSVHLWQGYEDKLIPFDVNRFIAEKLKWIKYHEVPDSGHMMIAEPNMCETIIRALVLR